MVRRLRSPEIIQVPIIPDNDWQLLISSTDTIDNAIEHMLRIHGNQPDELLLIIGREWADKFTASNNYHGVELRMVDQQAILLLPKLDQTGNPMLVNVAGTHYLTIKGS
jgi:hypothetical protein